MTTPAVRLEGLTKDFAVGFLRQRSVRGLDAVTLDVQQGEVLGYLGPNGAGKTTTLKLLLQLLYPTAGRAEILGRPAGDLDTRGRIGFLPETPYFYDNLTAEELLFYFGRLFGLSRAEARRRAGSLLDRVGLGTERRLVLRRCSKGMLQRVGIAQALINDPEVIFLDEPLAGLDPLGRRDIRHLLTSLRDEGRTLFFSSHILSDAEAVCSHIAILSRGQLVASGRIADLGLRVKGWELVVANIAPARLQTLDPPVGTITPVADGRYVLELPAGQPPEPILMELAGGGAHIVSLTPHHETLEEFFVARVGGQDAEP